MKKYMYLLLLGLVVVLSGCGTKEEDPMLVLCEDVNSIVSDYENNNIDKEAFINKITALEDRCTTEDYLCTTIKSFKIYNSNYKDEIFDALGSELKRNCQLIQDKQK